MVQASNDHPGKTPAVRASFWRFSIGQLCLLVVAVAVLCAIIARPLDEQVQQRREDKRFRQRNEAYNNLDKAVRQNDLQLAQQTLQLGFPAQELTARGNASPDNCVANGQLEMLELLLEYGVKRPALSCVLGLGSLQSLDARKNMAQLLIKYGADAAEPPAMDMAVRQYNIQSAEMLEELGAVFGPRELAAFNRLEALKKLVQDQPVLLRQRFGKVVAGEDPTLLGLALAGGHRELSLYLIDAGAPLDWVEGLGQTMLHRAARGGDPQLIRRLVARGLDVDARDDYRDTPLRDISGVGKPAAVKTLLELGADVNTQGMSKFTPLYSAVVLNRADLVRI